MVTEDDFDPQANFDNLRSKGEPWSTFATDLLGCSWGRKIWSLEDKDPCDRVAKRIVIVRKNGVETETQLCDEHQEVVNSESEAYDPQDGGTARGVR